MDSTGLRVTDRNGGRRHHETPLPSTAELDAIVRDLIMGALRVRDLYRRELEQAMGAPGSSEIKISGGSVAKPTERAWTALQGPATADCRRAAKALRDARDYVAYAHGELGGPPQPRVRDPRAVIERNDYDRTVHREREQELREE